MVTPPPPPPQPPPSSSPPQPGPSPPSPPEHRRRSLRAIVTSAGGGSSVAAGGGLRRSAADSAELKSKGNHQICLSIIRLRKEESNNAMASQLPLGYRFCPSDVEIVDHYLQAFMSGKSPPAPTINEFDVYSVAPWDLPGKFIHGERGNEDFFLTTRHKHGARIKRTVGQHGAWYPNNTDTRIIGTDAIAFKVPFVFKRSNGVVPKPKSTDWLMHEYRFKDSDLALCRIFDKNRRTDNDDVELAPDTDLRCTYFTVPPGFRFAPTDKEILFYLKRMVAGIQVPTVLRFDVYAKEPWDLPGGFRQGCRMNEQLFFTQRIAKSSGAQRTVEGDKGCWRSSHECTIRSGQQLLGHRTYLTFKRREKGKKITTEWLMYEYRLGSDSAEFQDSAICKVYRNRRVLDTPGIQVTPLRELPIEGDAASPELVEQHPTKRRRIKDAGSPAQHYHDGFLDAASPAQHHHDDFMDAAPPAQHHHDEFLDASSVSKEGTESKERIEEADSSSHHQDNVKTSSVELQCVQGFASQFERDQVEEVAPPTPKDNVKASSVEVQCVQGFASQTERDQVEEVAPPTPKEDVMEVTSSMEPAQMKKGKVGEPKELAQLGSQSTAPHRAYEAITWLATKPNWANEKIIQSWLDGNLFAEESNFAGSLEYLVFSLTQFLVTAQIIRQGEEPNSSLDSQSNAPQRTYEAVAWLAAKPKWVNENIIRSWLDGNLFHKKSNFASSLEYLLSNVPR